MTNALRRVRFSYSHRTLGAPATRNWIIILSLVLSIALWCVVVANREAMIKRIDQRVQELETLRSSMLSSPES
jgi:hypothetical protein